jgi:hypothetical protein
MVFCCNSSTPCAYVHFRPKGHLPFFSKWRQSSVLWRSFFIRNPGSRSVSSSGGGSSSDERGDLFEGELNSGERGGRFDGDFNSGARGGRFEGVLSSVEGAICLEGDRRCLLEEGVLGLVNEDAEDLLEDREEDLEEDLGVEGTVGDIKYDVEVGDRNSDGLRKEGEEAADKYEGLMHVSMVVAVAVDTSLGEVETSLSVDGEEGGVLHSNGSSIEVTGRKDGFGEESTLRTGTARPTASIDCG